MTNKIKVYYEIEFPDTGHGRARAKLIRHQIQETVDYAVEWDKAKVTGGAVVIPEGDDGE